MKQYTFTPNFKRYGNVFEDNEFVVDDNMIKNEPMFFSSDFDFVNKNGKNLTLFVLHQISRRYANLEWSKIIIDTRSHMLMPGFWPCIPGWHHDDVPRSRKDGQPNYDDPEYNSEHIMVVIGSSAMPQFLKRSCILPEVPEGRTVYQVWDRILDATFDENDFYTVDSGDIYYFDDYTFHRGMPSTKHCWRWFIRLSWNTERKVYNEIRNQVQVYISDPSIGW